MRRLLLVSILPVAAISFSAFSATRDRGVDPQVHTVMVTMQCGPGADSVYPVELHAKRGDEIVWQMTPESDAHQIRIKKKNLFGRWLFRTNVIEGDRQNPARGRDMKEDAEGLYRYDVIGICQGGPNELIDPDIIIDLD